MKVGDKVYCKKLHTNFRGILDREPDGEITHIIYLELNDFHIISVKNNVRCFLLSDKKNMGFDYFHNKFYIESDASLMELFQIMGVLK